MAKTTIILSAFVLFNILTLLVSHGNAISSCHGPCSDLNDCSGELICINGQCNDDPNVRTSTCSTGVNTPLPSDTCRATGSLVCNEKSYPTYNCSPPVTSSTKAKLTHNDFNVGGDGGYPSRCDEMFHENTEKVVALSTGWYDGGSRCGKMIVITSKRTGKSTSAKVVDECDSGLGCDEEHAYLPPCESNIVDGSSAVWTALGLDTDEGIEDISWSMA